VRRPAGQAISSSLRDCLRSATEREPGKGRQLRRVGSTDQLSLCVPHIELARPSAKRQARLKLGRTQRSSASGERLANYGTGTNVVRIRKSALSSDAALELAACDVLFGCMDSVEGRDLLNRVAVFHSIPYFDLGIQLRADGTGGVDTVCGSVHFLTPDGSSLLSRGVYPPEMLAAKSLRRTDPERYAREVKEGYVRGVQVGAPAVISVNGYCASMAVNELLARLHLFGTRPTRNIAGSNSTS
jgi:hypothetical protein